MGYHIHPQSGISERKQTMSIQKKKEKRYYFLAIDEIIISIMYTAIITIIIAKKALSLVLGLPMILISSMNRAYNVNNVMNAIVNG